jgi:hypothetical protein
VRREDLVSVEERWRCIGSGSSYTMGVSGSCSTLAGGEGGGGPC